jgi:hypothetical protein
VPAGGERSPLERVVVEQNEEIARLRKSHEDIKADAKKAREERAQEREVRVKLARELADDDPAADQADPDELIAKARQQKADRRTAEEKAKRDREQLRIGLLEKVATSPDLRFLGNKPALVVAAVYEDPELAAAASGGVTDEFISLVESKGFLTRRQGSPATPPPPTPPAAQPPPTGSPTRAQRHDGVQTQEAYLMLSPEDQRALREADPELVARLSADFDARLARLSRR